MGAPRPNSLRSRENMVFREGEQWKPPAITHSKTKIGRLVGAVRRFVDLQAGSIYRDVAAELAEPHGVVLDVGCGGQPLRHLVPSADTYIGIDIAEARDWFGYEVPDTLYYKGDTWPVEDASVDLVLCTEALEHVREPAKFIAEAARVARPGGTILLTVPFAARWHFIPHDYWRFTPSGLRSLLEENGFTDVEVYARGNQVTVACYKGMALILPLLMSPGASLAATVSRRFAGLLSSPALLPLAALANVSLRGKGGDDCIGYTAVARRK